MKLRSRQLRSEVKTHIKLSGLKPSAMAGWANRNLVDWLNNAKSVGVERVLKILLLAQQARALTEETRLASSSKEYMSCIRRLNPVLDELDTVLLRYNCKAEVFHCDGSLHRHYLFCAPRTKKSEVVAIAFLLENLPVLHRIRRCLDCRCWFFGITEHQKYCGDSCRKRHAAQGEEFLEHRRLYMRDYRRKEKMAEQNSKKFARRK